MKPLHLHDGRVRPVLLLGIICSFGCLGGETPVKPIPESEQAAMALKILEAYQGPRPLEPVKKLHVVYYTPADREPAPRYEERLDAIMKDIQSFYRDEMKRLGFGPMTFAMPLDGQGRMVMPFVKGKEKEAAFPVWKERPGTGDLGNGDKVKAECRSVLEAVGVSYEQETILIFCNLANWDKKKLTFSHHSPYFGGWTQTNGICYAADTEILNIDDIPKKKPIIDDEEYGKMSLGKFNTIFIGGIAHELGHAFALPHCGERWDEKPLGTSIMGAGNHTYRNERRGRDVRGSFLTMASAMSLAGRPVFNGWGRGIAEEARLETCQLKLSTNLLRSDLAGRRAALHLEGAVVGTPPIYGVVAYFDSIHDGGYRAPTATSVPNADGRFAIEVSDLAPCTRGDLRVELCHVNGWINERHLPFTVNTDGRVDLLQAQIRLALDPVVEAVTSNRLNAARVALQSLEASDAPELAKEIGRKLVGTIEPGSKLKPADIPAAVAKLALGDTRPDSASVGWLSPAANRIPPNTQIADPFLDCGKLYATGFYAHAASSYVFDLGGKWKQLTGEAGMHTLQQAYGSVIFIIKTDDREVFRSGIVRGPKKVEYQINLTGVKRLELVVEPTAEGNHNAWGLWLDPILSR